MTLDLTPDELLSTTRAVRKRLDFDRPVARSLVLECVELALQAPTGGNRQSWHFVIVDDPGKKQALAELYARGFDPYIAALRPVADPADTRAQRFGVVKSSAVYLRENLHRAPYLVIPCAEGRPAENPPVAAQAAYWGSLLPAFWSFMLAARARGLGTAWTTLHLPFEREAAEVLGIPYDHVVQGGMTPVAHTLGTEFRSGPRLDAASVTHWNGW